MGLDSVPSLTSGLCLLQFFSIVLIIFIAEIAAAVVALVYTSLVSQRGVGGTGRSAASFACSWPALGLVLRGMPEERRSVLPEGWLPLTNRSSEEQA